MSREQVRQRRTTRFTSLGMLFLCLVVAMLAWLAIMSSSGLPGFKTIVCLELCAWTQGCSGEIDRMYEQATWQKFLTSIHVDYPFILLYGTLFAVALLHVAQRLPGRLERFTRWLVMLVVLAALCDVAENLLLTAMILEKSDRLGVLMSLFASIKFAILVGIIGWWLAMWLRSWAVTSARA